MKKQKPKNSCIQCKYLQQLGDKKFFGTIWCCNISGNNQRIWVSYTPKRNVKCKREDLFEFKSCSSCFYNKTVTITMSKCDNPESKYYGETDDSGNMPWNKGCKKHKLGFD